MAHRSYNSNNRRLILELATDRVTFRGATPMTRQNGGTPSVVLSLKKHVGRTTSDLAFRMTHLQALNMLIAVSGCIAHEGTSKAARAAAELLRGTQKGQSMPGRAGTSRREMTGPAASERLLDDDAFRDPDAALQKLEPVEALRLLESAEPRLAVYVERRLADLMIPLRAAAIDERVVQQVHRKAVRTLVASLLTLRRSYRDLYSDLLPGEATGEPTDFDEQE